MNRIVVREIRSRQNSVFYKPPREEFETRLPGKIVDGAVAIGRSIRVRMEPGLVLVLEEFGGRVTYHEAGAKLPKKYHLLLNFDDDSFLTVAIQRWGFLGILTESELENREYTYADPNALPPFGEAFTVGRFHDLLADYEQRDNDSIKTFFTNGKSVGGIGNGYLQDILFRGKVSAKRKVGDIRDEEVATLHQGVKETIEQAIALDGRESERDLFGNPGRYKPLLDKYAAGKPCTVCGTAIKKISYLGGSCYICPACQR